MSSAKVLLCDLCVLLVFCASLVFSNVKESSSQAPEDGVKGNCTCGGFDTDAATTDSSPVLSQNPGLTVKCDESGEDTCKNLCLALATAAKAKGPDVICGRLQTANEMKLSAYFKICDKPWVYANMTAEEPLCCEASKAKTCPSLLNTNATTVAQ